MTSTSADKKIDDQDAVGHHAFRGAITSRKGRDNAAVTVFFFTGTRLTRTITLLEYQIQTRQSVPNRVFWYRFESTIGLKFTGD